MIGSFADMLVSKRNVIPEVQELNIHVYPFSL